MEIEILFLAKVINDGIALVINIVPEGKYIEATKVIPSEFISNLNTCKNTNLINVTIDEDIKDGLYKKVATRFYNDLKKLEK